MSMIFTLKDIKRSVGDLSYLSRSDDGTVTRQINYRRIQSNRVKRHIGMHSTSESRNKYF